VIAIAHSSGVTEIITRQCVRDVVVHLWQKREVVGAIRLKTLLELVGRKRFKNLREKIQELML
jgi:hypothetical protein